MTDSADKRKAVYVLRDDLGAIRYVGVTKSPAHRLKRHLTDAPWGAYHVNRWINSLLKRGARPTMEVVEWAEDWTEAEPRWIAKCRADGCRLVNGNDGGADMRQTERGPPSPAYKTFQRRLAGFQERAEPEVAARIAELRRQMREQHWRSLLPEWMNVPG